MMNPAMMRKPVSIIPYLYSPSGGALLTTKDGQAVAYTAPLEMEKDGWERRLQGYTGGSLPSSQSELDEDEDYMDVQSDSRGSTSPPLTPTASPDPLYTDTRNLLHRFYREWAGDTKEDGDCPKALPTVRRLAGEINEKHRMAFQGMLQKLSIQRPEDIQKLSEVPSMVFSDGITNWGRIVTLISFGAFVAKYLKSIHMENCVGTLADSFTDYLMTHKKAWIVEHNGWDGCVEFFHVEDYESGLKTVLMAFAGVAGLGASLAYMIR